ncbi:MAG TPA: vWA domain-containing protein [Vicinamibacterales bacterium]
MRGPISRLIELAILVTIFAVIVTIFFGRRDQTGTPPPAAATSSTRETDQAGEATLKARLQPPADRQWKPGLAAIVLVDVSGSMRDRVRDAKGERTRKLVLAQQATMDLIGAFDKYAREHPGEPVLVGVYEFSSRRDQPAARPVVQLGPPDPVSAARAVLAMEAEGGTPIGDAMIDARLALDASGLQRRHLLVVTDGENTDGVDPARVARVLESQEGDARAALYFVAFDIEAEVFEEVRRSGGLLLSANDGAELASTFDTLLSDRILVEAPRN